MRRHNGNYDFSLEDTLRRIGRDPSHLTGVDVLAFGTIHAPEICGTRSVKSSNLARCDSVILASFASRFLCMTEILNPINVKAFSDFYIELILKSLSAIYGLDEDVAYRMLNDRYDFYDMAVYRIAKDSLNDALVAIFSAFGQVLTHTCGCKKNYLLSDGPPAKRFGSLVIPIEAKLYGNNILGMLAKATRAAIDQANAL